MAVSDSFPTIKPSLNLDFANVKDLDPRITFTRASTATYYDGVTTAKAEENLLLQSQTFGSASWVKYFSGVTANNATAPDSSNTATLYDNTGWGQYLGQTTTQAASKTYAFSVFVKAGTSNWISMRNYAIDTYAQAWFNLSTGVVGAIGVGITANITDVGNGWYRCSITGTTPATIITNFAYVTTAVGDGQTSGTGNIYVWGAQLEQRSSVTDYTVTTTQPITNYIPALKTSANNSARFDHNPVTGESLGLLIEEQRTNLLTYSEQFDNAAWTKNSATVAANSITSPDGLVNADKVVENTSNAEHRIYQSASATAGQKYTFSVHLKAGERTWAEVGIQDTTGSVYYRFIDLSSGTAGGSGNITASITPIGNGWNRVSVSITATGAGTIYGIVWAATTNNVASYSGDGYSGFYIWGAQLEVGAFPTSYIPTVASQVTRSADAASMTGANFSSWYNQSEGTWHSTALGKSTGNYILAASDGTASNRNILGLGNLRIVSSGVDQCDIYSSSGLTANSFFNTASAYMINNFTVSGNAGAITADTSGTLPSVNQLQISANGADTTQSNHIKRIAYYPKRLSNTQIQAITS